MLERNPPKIKRLMATRNSGGVFRSMNSGGGVLAQGVLFELGRVKLPFAAPVQARAWTSRRQQCNIPKSKWSSLPDLVVNHGGNETWK